MIEKSHTYVAEKWKGTDIIISPSNEIWLPSEKGLWLPSGLHITKRWNVITI